jgi:hypothetical protein
MQEHGFMLGDGTTYNAFLPEARELYWNQANNGLFIHGIFMFYFVSSLDYYWFCEVS